MTTVIRAAGAADFLALVPRLLGFVPTASVVLVPFSGNRTIGAMRFDLPVEADTDEIESIASTMIGLVCKVANADAVAVVVYTGDAVADAAGLPHPALAGALVERADLCGLRVSDALCVAGDAWGSYLDPHLPPAGRALTDIPHDDAAFADLPLTPGGQRAGVELPTVAVARRRRIAAALRRGEGASDEMPTETFERMLAVGPDDLADADLVTLIWALSRPALRDVALSQWATDHETGDAVLDAQLAWAQAGVPFPADLATTMWGEGPLPGIGRLHAALELARRAAAAAPRERRAGALASCAWIAWALGRSTHAQRYVDLACAIEAEHGLAHIVQSFLAVGHLPEWAFARPAPPRGPVTHLVDSQGVETDAFGLPRRPRR
jgi:hypothetical protein